LLFLKAVVLDNFGLEQATVGLVFGFNNHVGLFRLALFDLQDAQVTTGQQA
jgi:hypothetical protein